MDEGRSKHRGPVSLLRESRRVRGTVGLFWLLAAAGYFLGCSSRPPDQPASTAAVIERLPIVNGDVEVTIGEGREIIAPPGSATAGSRWIEHSVTYTN